MRDDLCVRVSRDWQRCAARLHASQVSPRSDAVAALPALDALARAVDQLDTRAASPEQESW